MTSGFSLLTALPVPISSGGSTATAVGPSAAAAALENGSGAQTIVSNPSPLALLTNHARSFSNNLFSLWFSITPEAPASFMNSSGTCPVLAPGSTGSAPCANVGISTFSATSLSSVIGGATIMEAPSSLDTDSATLANSNALLPRTSG